MSDLSSVRPAPDDVLVRCLDHAASPAEIDAVERGAGVNAHRLSALRAASDRFAESVAALDVPPLPQLRDRRRRMPAVAAVALLAAAGALAALPATRALLADAADRAPGGSSPSPESPAVAPSGRAIVRIPWTAPGFLVEVEKRQVRGSIRLERGTGPVVTASATAAELLVLPDRLLVRNAGTDSSDVWITVPPGLERLIVRIAGRERIVDLRAEVPAVIGIGPNRADIAR